MDFGSGGTTDSKAWRDIWGAGQGVGAVDAVGTVRELVERLRSEYDDAVTALTAGLPATR